MSRRPGKSPVRAKPGMTKSATPPRLASSSRTFSFLPFLHELVALDQHRTAVRSIGDHHPAGRPWHPLLQPFDPIELVELAEVDDAARRQVELDPERPSLFPGVAVDQDVGAVARDRPADLLDLVGVDGL